MKIERKKTDIGETKTEKKALKEITTQFEKAFMFHKCSKYFHFYHFK